MKSLITIAAFIYCGMFLSTAYAKEHVYIHNTHDGTVSKIAIPELEVVRTIEIGNQIDYVTRSPDHATWYVNRINLIDPDSTQKWGESGELMAMDSRTDEMLWSVDLDCMPNHMKTSPDGRYVYVPCFDSYWLIVVDTEQQAVVDKIFTGMGGHVTEVNRDGSRVYVGSMYWSHISVVDTERREAIERIDFPQLVRPFAFTRDEQDLYVQLSQLHGFIHIDRETGERETHYLPDFDQEVPVGSRYPWTVNHGIELVKNESELWIVATAMDFIAVYSHPELELITTIPTGSYPNAIAFNGDESLAFVGNPRSNDVTVIDTNGYEAVATVPVGTYPQRLVVVDVPED